MKYSGARPAAWCQVDIRVGKKMVLSESVSAKLISSTTSYEKRKQTKFHVMLRAQVQPASISLKLNIRFSQ